MGGPFHCPRDSILERAPKNKGPRARPNQPTNQQRQTDQREDKERRKRALPVLCCVFWFRLASFVRTCIDLFISSCCCCRCRHTEESQGKAITKNSKSAHQQTSQDEDPRPAFVTFEFASRFPFPLSLGSSSAAVVSSVVRYVGAGWSRRAVAQAAAAATRAPTTQLS